MDICLYCGEIGTCPLSFARMARTFADFIHSSSPKSAGVEAFSQVLCGHPRIHIESKEQLSIYPAKRRDL
jgi:hypothetical protein